jgi:hypothetical protein
MNNPRAGKMLLLAASLAMGGVVPFKYALDTKPKRPEREPQKLATPSQPVKGTRKLSRAERKRERAKKR